MTVATLHFFCGKAGAGKSTTARALAAAGAGLLLSEDVWLARLYGDQIRVFDDTVRCSQRLQSVAAPLVVELLTRGVSVVMDFQANTRRRRSWFRAIVEEARADHLLHVLDTPDALCLQRIRQRNAEMPEGASRLTEADYWHVTSFFEAPQVAEGLRMRTHAP